MLEVIIFVLRYPTEKEYLLRNVRPLSHKKAKKEEADYDPAWAKYNSKVPKVLPPLVQRPQVLGRSLMIG